MGACPSALRPHHQHRLPGTPHQGLRHAPRYRAAPWQPDGSFPYPNHWDDTDYMQHRVIGTVVMTVHEMPGNRLTRYNQEGMPVVIDQVLRPGNYSIVPRITEWAAPSHVLTDRQVPTETRQKIHAFDNPSLDRPDDPGFRQWPVIPPPERGLPASRARPGAGGLRPRVGRLDREGHGRVRLVGTAGN